MEWSTGGDRPQIPETWPMFERLVGLRGGKMDARVDGRHRTDTVCTPIKPGDDPEILGPAKGTSPSGVCLRGCRKVEPTWIYSRIGLAVRKFESRVDMDQARPAGEFYRRHDVLEPGIPIP